MNNSRGNIFRYFPVLSKIKIMVPVSLTGFTGYFMCYPKLSPQLFFVTLGILFLAISASILNQIQEVKSDRLMPRTRNRPLPAGKIYNREAWMFFAGCFAAGVFFMHLTGSITALIISLLTLTWYNGIYTPLKRWSAYAVIPGSLTGALPPLVGWTAAGGSVTNPEIISLSLLMFAGQIPHFWLFILKYGGEYRLAGLPSLTSKFGEEVIRRLVFIFILVTAGIVPALFFSGAITGYVFTIALIALAVLLVVFFSGILTRKWSGNINRYSAFLYAWFGMILLILLADSLF